MWACACNIKPVQWSPFEVYLDNESNASAMLDYVVGLARVSDQYNKHAYHSYNESADY